MIWDGKIQIKDEKTGEVTGTSGIDAAKWLVYTYDLWIEEFDAKGKLVTSFGYKYPYCESITSSCLHDVNDWQSLSDDTECSITHNDEEEEEEETKTGSKLFYKYSVNNHTSVLNLATDSGSIRDLAVLTLDRKLASNDPRSVTTPSIDSHESLKSDDELDFSTFSGWHSLYTGKDYCYVPYRRDHKEAIILTKHDAVDEVLSQMRIIVAYDGSTTTLKNILHTGTIQEDIQNWYLKNYGLHLYFIEANLEVFEMEGETERVRAVSDEFAEKYVSIDDPDSISALPIVNKKFADSTYFIALREKLPSDPEDPVLGYFGYGWGPIQGISTSGFYMEKKHPKSSHKVISINAAMYCDNLDKLMSKDDDNHKNYLRGLVKNQIIKYYDDRPRLTKPSDDDLNNIPVEIRFVKSPTSQQLYSSIMTHEFGHTLNLVLTNQVSGAHCKSVNCNMYASGFKYLPNFNYDYDGEYITKIIVSGEFPESMFAEDNNIWCKEEFNNHNTDILNYFNTFR